MTKSVLVVLIAVLSFGCSTDSQPEAVCEANASAKVVHESGADEPALSPVREEGEGWKASLGRELIVSLANVQSTENTNSESNSSNSDPTPSPTPHPTPAATPVIAPDASDAMERGAVFYTPDIDISKLPEWHGSEADLMLGFKTSRDERRYEDDKQYGFMRRALWLYPYTGCFVRAAHVAQSYERLNFPRPGKLFVFGDLRVDTPYDKRGYILWSYHVAAAYRMNGKALILDAAISPLKPLVLEEWLGKISKDIGKVKIAICETNAYTPLNRCWGGRLDQERTTEKHLKSYLPDEWRRLSESGFDSKMVLGDEPPWKALEAVPTPAPTPASTPETPPGPTPETETGSDPTDPNQGALPPSNKPMASACP